MTKILFISDLHLSSERPKITENFLQFIKNHAYQADHLYILGDFFDVWIGDDNQASPIPEIMDALNQLNNAETKISIQHGNRDFLIGKKFSQESCAELLPEEHVIQLGNHRCLLMHGDQLCSDDVGYQQAKQMLRSDAFIHDFLSKSLEERAQIASAYRQQSGETTSLLAEDIMDVNQQTLDQFFADFKVDTVIHGHTHRPKHHQYNSDRQRFVLTDWSENRIGWLEFEADSGFKLCVKQIT